MTPRISFRYGTKVNQSIRCTVLENAVGHLFWWRRRQICGTLGVSKTRRKTGCCFTRFAAVNATKHRWICASLVSQYGAWCWQFWLGCFVLFCFVLAWPLVLVSISSSGQTKILIVYLYGTTSSNRGCRCGGINLEVDYTVRSFFDSNWAYWLVRKLCGPLKANGWQVWGLQLGEQWCLHFDTLFVVSNY